MVERYIGTKIRVYTPDECDAKRKNLIETAKTAASKAYAPYSGYRVGVALQLADGTVIQGNNQENAAYSVTLCAERTALLYAGANFPNLAVVRLAVVAFWGDSQTNEVCTPCGSCRQVLLETEKRFGQKIAILMCGKEQIWEVDSASALLPLAFGG